MPEKVSDSFMADGACRDIPTVIFFPEGNYRTDPEVAKQVDLAKKICKSCTVREKCLEYALENDITPGIWGGMTEDERKAYRKRWLVAKRLERVSLVRNTIS